VGGFVDSAKRNGDGNRGVRFGLNVIRPQLRRFGISDLAERLGDFSPKDAKGAMPDGPELLSYWGLRPFFDAGFVRSEPDNRFR